MLGYYYSRKNVLMSRNLDEGLIEALERTSTIVDTIEERYRELAFPIILKVLVGASDGPRSTIAGTTSPDTKEPISTVPSIPESMSVNEFFRKVSPSSHPERFVCAAYYLLHTGKAEKFTTADILEIYEKLRQPKPGNPSDVVYKCIKKADIIDGPSSGDKQKYWVITPEGEKLVEELLHEHAGLKG